jgi:hypothetical protein
LTFWVIYKCIMLMRYKSEFNELHWCRSLAWSMLNFLDPSP